MTGPVAHGRCMKNSALKLTDAVIEAGKSTKGGFTRKQLAAWGVPWPPVQGWRAALLAGRPIPKRRNRLDRKKTNRGGSPRSFVGVDPRSTANRVAGCEDDLPQLENQVYRLAAYLIERGHHDAAEALAGDVRGAALYLAELTTTNGETGR